MFPDMMHVGFSVNKGSTANLANEICISTVGSEVTIQILFSCTPLGAIHAGKMLNSVVSHNVILEVGQLFEFFATNSTCTLQSTIMVIMNDLQVCNQIFLRSTYSSTVETNYLLFNSMNLTMFL